MKTLYLFLLISISNLPIHAMLQEEVFETDEASILTLSVSKRAFVLRLVMLNSLINGDYSAVSHVLEKTKLDPGPFFRGLFEKGPILGKHIYYKIGGIVYYLYKAALENNHKRAIRLIQDEECVGQAHAYAMGYDDRAVGNRISQNISNSNQIDEYNKDIKALNRIQLENKGKLPMKKEEWTNSLQRKLKKWLRECEEKSKSF